jgi:hypothetical protein
MKAQIAPVGDAWQAARKADPKLMLHSKDQKHPTPAGAYLAACVFYATIYEKSPEWLPGSIGKLTDDEARALQTIAWKTVQATRK